MAVYRLLLSTFIVIIVLLHVLTSYAILEQSNFQEDFVKKGLKQCKSGSGEELVSDQADIIDHLSIPAYIEWRQKLSSAMKEQTVEGLNCVDLEYVNQLLTLEKSMASLVSNKQRLFKISDVDSELNYQAIFENLILTNKIFKGKYPSKMTYKGGLDFSDISHHQVESTRDVPLHRVLSKESYLDVNVPKVVMNNYIWRLLGNSTAASSITEDDHLNILTHWPSVTLLSKSGSATVHATTCPLNMNQIIWGVDDGRALVARVFSHAASGSLSPLLGHRYSTLFNSSLHYVNFDKNGFDDIDEANVKFREVTLSSGEYLYVPNSNPVSVMLPTGSNADDSPSVTYLRACVVDASNLNLFRESLEKYQKISKHYRDLYTAITELDYIMTRSPKDLSLSEILKFNFQQESASLQQPSEKDKKDRRQRKSNANLRDWQETAKWNGVISSLTMSRPSKPEITEISRAGGKVSWISSFAPNLKDQSVFGFNLTICEVSGDEVEELDTSGSADEVNGGNDRDKCQYVFAYRVADKDTPASNKAVLIEPHSQGAARANVYSTIVQTLTNSVQYKIRANTVYTSFQSLSSEWSDSFRTKALAPPAEINCLYDKNAMGAKDVNDLKDAKSKSKRNAASKSSSRVVRGTDSAIEFCLTAQTLSATEAVISFRPSSDDGGMPLLGYFIFAKEITEVEEPSTSGNPNSLDKTEGEWREVAFLAQELFTKSIENRDLQNGNLKGKILHLFPGVSYQFRVVVANSLGNSSHSRPSNIITTQALAVRPALDQPRPLLLGNFHARHSIRDYHRSLNSESIASKFLYISDATQEIRAWGDQDSSFSSTSGAWRSHFSPAYVDVEGDCLYLQGPIRTDYRNVHGRIVMVRRDRKTPFYMIALSLQRAGALGVVIADDGACKDYDQACVPFANKRLGEFFGQYDPPKLWKGLKLPVVLVLKNVSDFLVSEGVCSPSSSGDLREEL